MWKRVGDVVVSWLVVGGEDRRYVVGEEEREGDEEGENCVDIWKDAPPRPDPA